MGQQKEEDGLEAWLSENATKVLKAVLGAALLVILTIGGLYFTVFLGPPLSIDPATLGQAGDYFGGLLNPALSFLSVFALLVALVIQSRELRLSREALKVSQEEQAKASAALDAQNKAIQHQSFEQTFFAWLGTYRELLASAEFVIDLISEEPEKKGRRALHRWWQWHLSPGDVGNEILSELGPLGAEIRIQYKGNVSSCLTGLPVHAKQAASKAALEAWERLYKEGEYQLDSLFRTLYKLLQWIDSQSPERLNSAQKWLYVSIVRSQLSWIELVYLFYNGHTHRGEKFKELAEKYALFDNLTFTSDPLIAVLKDGPPRGSGYRSTAYDSRLARKSIGLPETTEDTLVMAAGANASEETGDEGRTELHNGLRQWPC